MFRDHAIQQQQEFDVGLPIVGREIEMLVEFVDENDDTRGISISAQKIDDGDPGGLSPTVAAGENDPVRKCQGEEGAEFPGYSGRKVAFARRTGTDKETRALDVQRKGVPLNAKAGAADSNELLLSRFLMAKNERSRIGPDVRRMGRIHRWNGQWRGTGFSVPRASSGQVSFGS